jgi:hypothetical protein
MGRTRQCAFIRWRPLKKPVKHVPIVCAFSRQEVTKMPDQNILAEAKPRLETLVSELVAEGAERNAVLYILEKEIGNLRRWQENASIDRATLEEPSNDWPSAE